MHTYCQNTVLNGPLTSRQYSTLLTALIFSLIFSRMHYFCDCQSFSGLIWAQQIQFMQVWKTKQNKKNPSNPHFAYLANTNSSVRKSLNEATPTLISADRTCFQRRPLISLSWHSRPKHYKEAVKSGMHLFSFSRLIDTLNYHRVCRHRWIITIADKTWFWQKVFMDEVMVESFTFCDDANFILYSLTFSWKSRSDKTKELFFLVWTWF